MVDMSALHSLTAEMHGGFLTLAFLCIMIVAGSQVVVRLKARLPASLVNVAVRVRGYAEAAGYVAAVAGVLGLLLSAWTGMYAWPTDVLLNSPIVRNKITLTVFSTTLWIGVIFIRTRFGRGLWTCPAMALVYVGSAIVAFGMVGMTGSLGAHLTPTIGQSVLDWLWKIINLNFRDPIVLTTNAAAALALISGGIIVLVLVVARRYDLFEIKLGPSTCQKIFKWDEPTIPTEKPKEA